MRLLPKLHHLDMSVLRVLRRRLLLDHRVDEEAACRRLRILQLNDRLLQLNRILPLEALLMKKANCK